MAIACLRALDPADFAFRPLFAAPRLKGCISLHVCARARGAIALCGFGHNQVLLAIAMAPSSEATCSCRGMFLYIDLIQIFLDYLRNDRMATAVAPLSTRAHPGVAVSMPLSWPQVKADLDPSRFSLRTVPPLLRQKQGVGRLL
jgi:hypothetical protein